MNHTKDKFELDEFKKREYFKQQQQLRTMAKRNVISADDMIENLLSRKEIFQKKKDMNQNTAKSNKDGPGWLVPGSGEVPWLYQCVWGAVGGGGLADTPRLSALLMTSRLPTDTLGYIWGLANHTVPGSLTQSELYLTLALVALAQNGYAFTNASVVNQVSEAPLPRLDLSVVGVGGVATVGVVQPAAPPAPVLPRPPPGLPLSTLSAADLNGALTGLPQLSSFSVPPRTLPPIRPPKPPRENREKTFSSVDVLNLALSGVPPPPLPRIDDILTGGGPPSDDEEFDDFKSAVVLTEPLTVLDLPKPLEPPPRRPELPNQQLLVNEPVLQEQLVEDLFPARPESSPPPPLSALFHLPNFPSAVTQTSDKIVEPNEEELDRGEAESEEDVRTIEIGEPLMMCEIKPAMVADSSEDRYSALRMLEEEESNKGGIVASLDEFGDFLTADDPPPPALHPLTLETVNQPDIQMRCMTACVKILRTALATLEGIKDPEILSEVVTDPRGQQYLNDIIEVYRVSERLKSHTEKGQLQNELDEVWKCLQHYIKDLNEECMENEEGAKCGVCLCEVGPRHVRYGINNFHAPCANLFLHCVHPVLPLAPVML